MLPTSASATSGNTVDDCTICLSALAPGTTRMTLPCNHQYHFQCLATNIKASNKECPLCRVAIDDSIIKLLEGSNKAVIQQQPPISRALSPTVDVVPSAEDLVDENMVRELNDRLTSSRQTSSVSNDTADNFAMITASTTLEYGAQYSHEESNIYGLITLQAPNSTSTVETGSIVTSHVPIDLVCIVDQSSSMSGDKIALLKQTLVYIAEQMNDLDRLAIISFNTRAYNHSHGFKRVTQQNKQALINSINNDINSSGGTFIGSGLEMGINLLSSRQTKNPLNAIFLLTDGQDNDSHDYTRLMQTLPSGIQCHTFGYGPDHIVSLLVKIAEEGNGGTFTYIDEERAIGPAFAMALGGLFTCVAQQIRLNIEFTVDYRITHIHAKYKYEPSELPSSKLAIHLYDLNAEEKRNIVFQLHVPKIDNNEQNAEMNSQNSTPSTQSTEEIQLFEKQIIGNIFVSYVNPATGRQITTDLVPFNLVRGLQLPNDLLQVNHVLDIQRNRVETTNALDQAMAEMHYGRSRAILQAQVDKIKASVSANDPFCQNLIKDLEYRYPTERAYRSCQNSNAILQRRERGIYMPSSNVSSRQYVNMQQTAMALDVQRNNNNKTS